MDEDWGRVTRAERCWHVGQRLACEFGGGEGGYEGCKAGAREKHVVTKGWESEVKLTKMEAEGLWEIGGEGLG